MTNWLIRNANVVNEGRIFQADVLVRNGRIEQVNEQGIGSAIGAQEFDAKGKYLAPRPINCASERVVEPTVVFVPPVF